MQLSAIPPLDPETIDALLDWYERFQANEADFEEGADETGIPLQELRLLWLTYHAGLAVIARRKELN